MGDAFRRLFLSIGVALGLASGQSDPALVARAFVEDGAVAVSARIEGAFAPGAVELVDTGTRVAIRFSATLDAGKERLVGTTETRSIWYDMRSGRYGVSFDGGKTAALVDPAAARTLVSEPLGIRVCEASDAGEGARIILRAEIGIIDSRGEWHDAPVLWNYCAPRAVLSVERPAASPKAGR